MQWLSVMFLFMAVVAAAMGFGSGTVAATWIGAGFMVLFVVLSIWTWVLSRNEPLMT